MSIETLIEHYGLIALFLGAAVEGETVVLAGGVLAHQELLPLTGTMAAAATGSFFADQLFFATGRYFRDNPRVQRLRESPAFARAIDAVERHPTRFVLGFRFLYGLRTISPIAIGTTTLPTSRFVALNALAAIIWGVVFSGIGYLFGNGLQRFFGHIHAGRLLAVLIGIGAATALCAYLFRRHRDSRSSNARLRATPQR